MCLNPTLIDNPYYGLSSKGLNYLHNTYDTKLSVPCGHCPVCLSLKQSYFVQRCQCEQFDNYLFMVTLTYNNDSLRSLCVNGYTLHYADFKDIQNMFKRIRNKNLFERSFRYWCVSEYGTKKRPHFHLILSLPKYSSDNKNTPYILEQLLFKVILSNWVRNYGSKRSPIYRPLCTYVCRGNKRNYDLHYINDSLSNNGSSDVAFYVSKYLLKYSKYVDSLHSALKLNLSPDEFNKIWFLLKPRCICSHNWGNINSSLVKNHIRKSIDVSIKQPGLLYPCFINPINGKLFPLSPYLKKKFFTLSDAHSFYFKYKEDNSTVTRLDALSDIQDINVYYSNYYDMCDILDSKYNVI